MFKKLLAVVLLGALAGGLWVALKPATRQRRAITIFCAAGLKKPVDAIATQYQEETGIEVRLQYGGTGTLLSQLQVARQGDLFLAADDGALADAKKLGVVQDEFKLVQQRPVLAVAEGNPKQLHSLTAIKQDGVKLALANPEAASIGRVTKKLLGPDWDALAAHATVMKPTVTEIAADLALGAVDAAIVWDAVVPQFKGLEKVELPELAKHQEHATASVLSFSQQREEALQFAHYLTAPNKGGSVFQKQGFTPVPGALWPTP